MHEHFLETVDVRILIMTITSHCAHVVKLDGPRRFQHDSQGTPISLLEFVYCVQTQMCLQVAFSAKHQHTDGTLGLPAMQSLVTIV